MIYVLKVDFPISMRESKRKVDPCDRISLHNLTFQMHKAPPREKVELRVVPYEEAGIVKLRIWPRHILTDVYQVKNSDLDSVRF